MILILLYTCTYIIILICARFDVCFICSFPTKSVINATNINREQRKVVLIDYTVKGYSTMTN